MAFNTMFFATLTKINAGIITTIWCVNPLLMAITDWCFFGIRLEYYHYIGMFAIVACTVILSLNGVFKNEEPVPIEEESPVIPSIPIETYPEQRLFKIKMPTVVAVLFSLATPLAFTTNGILTKHLTNKELNPFNPDNLSFSSYAATNIVVLIAAIPYWVYVSFSLRLFIVGLVAGLINTLGLVCV